MLTLNQLTERILPFLNEYHTLEEITENLTKFFNLKEIIYLFHTFENEIHILDKIKKVICQEDLLNEGRQIMEEILGRESIICKMREILKEDSYKIDMFYYALWKNKNELK